MKSLQLGESCSVFQRYCQTLAMGSNPSCDTSPRDHSCTAVPEPRHSCPCTARSRTRFLAGRMTFSKLPALIKLNQTELSTFATYFFPAPAPPAGRGQGRKATKTCLRT